MGLLTEIARKKTEISDFETRKNENRNSKTENLQNKTLASHPSEKPKTENQNLKIENQNLKIQIQNPCEKCKSVFFWVQKITRTVRCVSCQAPPSFALAEMLVGIFQDRSGTRIGLQVDRQGRIYVEASVIESLRSSGVGQHSLVEIDVSDYVVCKNEKSDLEKSDLEKSDLENEIENQNHQSVILANLKMLVSGIPAS